MATVPDLRYALGFIGFVLATKLGAMCPAMSHYRERMPAIATDPTPGVALPYKKRQRIRRGGPAGTTANRPQLACPRVASREDARTRGRHAAGTRIDQVQVWGTSLAEVDARPAAWRLPFRSGGARKMLTMPRQPLVY